jgi:hypothetical protein
LARHRGLGAEPLGEGVEEVVIFLFSLPFPSRERGNCFSTEYFLGFQLEQEKRFMKEGFSLVLGMRGARVVGSGRKDILPWGNLSVVKLTRPSSVGGSGCYLPQKVVSFEDQGNVVDLERGFLLMWKRSVLLLFMFPLCD